jgi:lysophospholipid acyltransferase (LPLAT)-like uncharacterized protein
MDTQSLNIHDKPPKRRNIAESMPFLPPFAAVALRLLHKTCRIEIVGKENYLAAEKINPRIAAFWHFAYPSVLYFYRDQGYLTIISRSRDGEFAARLVKSLGYNPFRGSPGKGGAAALKGIISAFRNGPGGGFVVDGSQGPAQVAQKGLLLLAMYSGCPIMPVSVAADRCWRFRSWDRTLLPKPFARVVFSWGPMVRVEKGASAAEMEECRVRLERILNEISGQAQKAVSGVCIKR